MFELAEIPEPANEGLVRVPRLMERLRQEIVGNAAPGASASQGLVERIAALADEVQRHVRAQAAEIERLRALALTDPLTGLLNRRGFEDVVDRALAAARRHGETGLLAILDLDGFKPVNDAHGHAAGDAVLSAVGRLLKSAIRATDCAARLGGDEFAVLFIHCSPEGARGRIRTIQKTIAALAVPWPTGELHARASLGTCDYGPEMCVDDLFAEADRAMYAEKRLTRTRELRRPA